MAQIEQSTIRNHLLAVLPPAEFAILASSLQREKLAIKQVLHAPHQSIDAVYFPEAGVVSMVALLQDGHELEVGMTGREGFVGVPAVLGGGMPALEAIVQLIGSAWRISAVALQQALEACPELKSLLLRYVLAFHGQVSQTAVCNGRHTLEERLARWLLMIHDRGDGDVLPLTQEFLSTMLGVRRAGVSVAASILQKAGVIENAKGRIRIADRAGLENAACECYSTVRRHFEQMIGWPVG